MKMISINHFFKDFVSLCNETYDGIPWLIQESTSNKRGKLRSLFASESLTISDVLEKEMTLTTIQKQLASR